MNIAKSNLEVIFVLIVRNIVNSVFSKPVEAKALAISMRNSTGGRAASFGKGGDTFLTDIRRLCRRDCYRIVIDNRQLCADRHIVQGH